MTPRIKKFFAFLTTKISESIFPLGNIVYITSGKSVLHLNIQMCLLPLQRPVKHAGHADFLPLYLNADIKSQPVTALNNIQDLDMGSPRLLQTFMLKNL